MSIEISIIIPAYNREKTIERAIRSIYSQTERPLEVIVVDDASTDDTTNIVQRLKKEYTSLVLLCENTNKGAQKARNRGVLYAMGNWIAFLDSDDEFLPNALSILEECILDNPQCDAVFGDGYTVYGNAVKYRRCGKREKNIYTISDVAFTEILFGNMLVKKEVLKKIGYLDSMVPAYQEMDTRLRIAQNCNFYYVSKPVFKYHMHCGDTISKNKRRNADGYRYVVLKNMDLIGISSDVDVIEIYFDGMNKRCVSAIEKFIYHGLLSVYNISNKGKIIKKLLKIIMKVEFLIRY